MRKLGVEIDVEIAPDLGTLSLDEGQIRQALLNLIRNAGDELAGPIGFVGLIVPHILRALVGPDHRRLLPVIAFAGAAALVACDLAARTILFPAEMAHWGG